MGCCFLYYFLTCNVIYIASVKWFVCVFDKNIYSVADKEGITDR